MKLTSCLAVLAIIAFSLLFTGCPMQEGQQALDAEGSEVASGEGGADVATSEGAVAEEEATMVYSINQALPGRMGAQSGSIGVHPGVGSGDGAGQNFVIGENLRANIGRVEEQQTGAKFQPYDPEKRCEEAVYSVRVNGVSCDHPENCVFTLPDATSPYFAYRMIITPAEAEIMTGGQSSAVELFNASLPDSKE
ncbi:MAG: hypothetical protein L0Y78_10420, partial [candidate division NC10 bacterium]|nr:hypothetical protein [candidate division NC10 bacterium]